MLDINVAGGGASVNTFSPVFQTALQEHTQPLSRLLKQPCWTMGLCAARGRPGRPHTRKHLLSILRVIPSTGRVCTPCRRTPSLNPTPKCVSASSAVVSKTSQMFYWCKQVGLRMRFCTFADVLDGVQGEPAIAAAEKKVTHGITHPQLLIEYGRLCVCVRECVCLMLQSVRSPCPFSFSVCPAWNFCLIPGWEAEAVINTPQYLPCPLVLRESFTASLLRSYVNQNVHQKPFATLSAAGKYMCTRKQPWQA